MVKMWTVVLRRHSYNLDGESRKIEVVANNPAEAVRKAVVLARNRARIGFDVPFKYATDVKLICTESSETE